jgi:cytochrome P450
VKGAGVGKAEPIPDLGDRQFGLREPRHRHIPTHDVFEDHRDGYLTEADRVRGDCFTPCCSRALSERLVLDRNGDLVMLSYPSASMDEEVFTYSHLFRVDRTPNRHMSFGFGAHACLGQNLARAELKAFFTQLLARIDRIESDGQIQWVQSNQVSGPKAMPIRYVATA